MEQIPLNASNAPVLELRAEELAVCTSSRCSTAPSTGRSALRHGEKQQLPLRTAGGVSQAEKFSFQRSEQSGAEGSRAYPRA